MSARLPTSVLVSALLRRINDAGGMGMVRARGDDRAGGILLIVQERGSPPRMIERGIGPSGAVALIAAGPAAEANLQEFEDYWQRRRARDPDLWVIDLDIADAERFAAETILVD